MTTSNSRIRFALRWSLIHFFVSLAVVSISAVLVFSLWYPSPWRQVLGVAGIFGVVVVVDVVCGPILTLLLANPQKAPRERGVDFVLVGVIQLLALFYGLWSVYSARPVILAFEVDRLVIVTANEVQVAQLGLAPQGFRSLPLTGVREVALRKARSQEEYLASLDQSLQGVSPAMRPSEWRPAEESRLEIQQKAKQLVELFEKHPANRLDIESTAKKIGVPLAELRYLPLTSSKKFDWTALISKDGTVVGFLPLDAFD